MATPETGHSLARTLHEVAWYPEHDPRKASSEYHRTHDTLVVKLDTPCWICGVKHSQVVNMAPADRKWAQLETHHSELEWASELAFEKDPLMLAGITADLGRSPQEHLASIVDDLSARIHGSDAAALREFLDSEGNMLVLCALHHRGSQTGIHSITYPIWKLQRYEFTPDAFQFVRPTA